MSIVKLNGKKIFITTPDEQVYVSPLQRKLTQFGATVVVSENSPHSRNNIPALRKEIGSENPDLVLVYHPTLGIEDGTEACIDLVQACRDMPVVVASTTGGQDRAGIAAVKSAGAKVVSINAPAIIAAVADTLAQHGKGQGAALGQ